MKRTMALLILVLLLIPAMAYAEDTSLQKGDSGADVVLVQQRLTDLGYIAFRATGRYGDMTETGVRNFQSRNGLSATGRIDSETYDALFSASPARAALNPGITRLVGPGLAAQPEEYGQLLEWSQMDQLIPVGSQFTVIDFNTRREYQVQRTGGTNHADVQTVDAASTDTFLQCFGGDYTWEKRPCLVEVDGQVYAASIFGTPNENAQVSGSTMPGSVCLYFSGSRSDILNMVDEEHDANILTAGTP